VQQHPQLRIVGWRIKTTKDTGLVLDALEQAVHERPQGRDRIQVRPPVA
jgi:hypothetical protein